MPDRVPFTAQSCRMGQRKRCFAQLAVHTLVIAGDAADPLVVYRVNHRSIGRHLDLLRVREAVAVRDEDVVGSLVAERRHTRHGVVRQREVAQRAVLDPMYGRLPVRSGYTTWVDRPGRDRSDRRASPNAGSRAQTARSRSRRVDRHGPDRFPQSGRGDPAAPARVRGMRRRSMPARGWPESPTHPASETARHRPHQATPSRSF